MSTRAEKALKSQKEKYHSILRELVQEEENKTCADCLAKGPRWASWSLGVFLCIRCAGIHRNLGVHISKVKSVDLDSWTTEQIEHILKWGNRRAGEYYECLLPKDFQRPQGNSAVEGFIRNKYERKLYLMKDGEPAPNPASKTERLKHINEPEASKGAASSPKRRDRPEKKKAAVTLPPAGGTILSIAKQTQSEEAKKTAEQAPPAQPAPAPVVEAKPAESSLVDLLSLDEPTPPPPAVNTPPVQQPPVQQPQSSSNVDLLNFGNFEQAAMPAAPAPAAQTAPSDLIDVGKADSTKKSTKESILSLYGDTSQQQPQRMYGVPGGVYMSTPMSQYSQPPMSMQTGMQMNTSTAYQFQQQMPNQVTNLQRQMQQMSMNQQQGVNQFGVQQQPPMNSMAFMSQPQQGMMQGQNQFAPRAQAQFPSGFPAQNSSVFPGGNIYPSGAQGMTQNGFGAPNSMNNMNPMNQNMMGWGSGNQSLMGMPQQKQPMANGPAGGNSMMMNFGMQPNAAMNGGHTLNNQLWN